MRLSERRREILNYLRRWVSDKKKSGWREWGWGMVVEEEREGEDEKNKSKETPVLNFDVEIIQPENFAPAKNKFIILWSFNRRGWNFGSRPTQVESWRESRQKASSRHIRFLIRNHRRLRREGFISWFQETTRRKVSEKPRLEMAISYQPTLPVPFYRRRSRWSRNR